MTAIDFHAHLSLQPYQMQIQKNGQWVSLSEFWHKRPKQATVPVSTVLKVLIAQAPYYSETHLDGALSGGVRCLVNPICPVERGFLKPGSKNDHPKNIWDNVLAYLTGLNVRSVNRIQNKELSYFAELHNEYMILEQCQFPNTNPDGTDFYKIVSSYQEILENTGISVLLSIEGGHALASNIYDASGQFIDPIVAEQQHLPEFETYKQKVIANINIVKTWKYPTLFISPSHHYYSHMAGLSESIPIPFLVEPQNIEIDGVSVYDMGLTEFGKTAITLLLANKQNGNNGRRVLIDVKHFSPNARIEYFNMVRGKGIPIIASHTAVNGRPTLSDYKHKKTCRPFNPANINLFDDEIVEICNSDGIIGLMFDKKRLYDNITEASLIDMKNTDIDEYKKMLFDVIIYQWLHIAKVSGGAGFEHICLGTDFDGGIYPMEIYSEFGAIPQLRSGLLARINGGLHGIKKAYRNEKDQLISDPEKYVDALLYGNAQRFLQTYFNDGYLKGI